MTLRLPAKIERRQILCLRQCLTNKLSFVQLVQLRTVLLETVQQKLIRSDYSMSNHYQGSAEEVLALDTYVKFVRALEAVKSRIDEQNTIGDLSGSQFGTLEMLYHLGPLHQKDIGHKLLISKSNVVAVIDKLEKQALVTRQRNVEDRRCIFVHLTDLGRERIEQILPEHVAAITQEMNRVTSAEQKELGRICRKLGLGK